MRTPPLALAILTPIIAPYRIPVFNELAARDDIKLSVYFLAEREPDRSWPIYREEIAFDHRVLRSRWIGTRAGSWIHVSTGFFKAARTHRFDVVIGGGWNHPTNYLAFELRSVVRYRFGWWVESTDRDRRKDSRLALALKKRGAASADTIVVPGTAARDYALALGASPNKIHVAPNAVDNRLFHAAAVDRSKRQDPTTFLFAGRLHPNKGLDVLLDAWVGGIDGARLSIVGEGSLRDHLQRRLSSEALPEVVLRGHLDRAGLLSEYRAADVFVFPSLSDPWGLVINEAMAAGLPVITTSAPGAARDMVANGANGFIVDPGDGNALRRCMIELAGDRRLRANMGEKSLQMVEAFSPSSCAAGLAAAAASAIGSHHGARP